MIRASFMMETPEATKYRFLPKRAKDRLRQIVTNFPNTRFSKSDLLALSGNEKDRKPIENDVTLLQNVFVEKIERGFYKATTNGVLYGLQ